MVRKVDLNPEDEMLSPPQIAQIWGCSAETVRLLIETDELKAVNFSRGKKQPRYRSKRKWVNEFIDQKACVSPVAIPRRRKNVPRKEFDV